MNASDDLPRTVRSLYRLLGPQSDVELRSARQLLSTNQRLDVLVDIAERARIGVDVFAVGTAGGTGSPTLTGPRAP